MHDAAHCAGIHLTLAMGGKPATGVAVVPKEIVSPVRRWMAPDFPNIRHWTEMPRGGHFAAFEQPALRVDDVRGFFRPLRQA